MLFYDCAPILFKLGLLMCLAAALFSICNYPLWWPNRANMLQQPEFPLGEMYYSFRNNAQSKTYENQKQIHQRRHAANEKHAAKSQNKFNSKNR